MAELKHLLKHDFLSLQRNNIITISVIVTAIYLGVFQAFIALPDAEKMLLLIIFVDPILLGFLFIGVIVLFEKNEHHAPGLGSQSHRRSKIIFCLRP